MNTPKDASDTAITRLFDGIAEQVHSERERDEPALDAQHSPHERDSNDDADSLEETQANALEQLDAVQRAAVSRQLGDIKRYFAICQIELEPNVANYLAMCLSCCYVDGYTEGQS